MRFRTRRELKYSERNKWKPPNILRLLKVDAVEVRFDYMGTSVLMGRISHLSAAINDDWHVTDAVSPTVRPAQIFLRGDLSWDQLQVS